MREGRITKELQKHDRKLYCSRNNDGVMCVYRKSKRYERFDLGEKEHLLYSIPSPHFIFALTDNWKSNGRPVDWGLEVISARIKAMDLWSRDVASELIKEYEKDAETSSRDAQNSMESFLYDFRNQFKKTFSDTRVANMDKTKIRSF